MSDWKRLVQFAVRAVGPGSVAFVRESAVEVAVALTGAEHAWLFVPVEGSHLLAAGLGWPEAAIGALRTAEPGEALAGLKLATRLSVPLAGGLLGVGSPRSGAFADDAAELLEAVAALAAVALDQRAAAKLAHDFN